MSAQLPIYVLSPPLAERSLRDQAVEVVRRGLSAIPQTGAPCLVIAPAGITAVEGFEHPAEHSGRFSATDDPVARHFYTLDPQKIGAALGLGVVGTSAAVGLGGVTRGGAGSAVGRGSMSAAS